MKKALSVLALSLVTLGAHAGLTVSASSVLSFQNYDSTPASLTGTLNRGVTGTLTATEAGRISFTYLGKEAWNANRFTFNGQSLFDDTRTGQTSLIGSSLSGNVGAGKVNFSFTDVTRGMTYANGDRGAIALIANVNTSRFGNFDYIVAFNDKGVIKDPRDTDFDDFVMGVKFTPAIPEPSTYALMALGLVGIAVAARRRQQG